MSEVIRLTEESMMQMDAHALARMYLGVQHAYYRTASVMLKRVVVEIDNGNLDIGIQANEVLEAIDHEMCDCNMFEDMVNTVADRLLPVHRVQ
jgi:hypothetical protein